MAQKSDYPVLNRIDELYDSQTLRQYYPEFAEEVRIGLLRTRSADWAVIKSQSDDGDPDPELIEAAQRCRQQLPLDDVMVGYYLPVIDSAFAQGI